MWSPSVKYLCLTHPRLSPWFFLLLAELHASRSPISAQQGHGWAIKTQGFRRGGPWE